LIPAHRVSQPNEEAFVVFCIAGVAAIAFLIFLVFLSSQIGHTVAG
jgi:hypothetical protein